MLSRPGAPLAHIRGSVAGWRGVSLARGRGSGTGRRGSLVPGGRGFLLGQRYGLLRQIQVLYRQDDRVLRDSFVALPAGHGPPSAEGRLRSRPHTRFPGRGPGFVQPSVIRSHA